MNRRALERAIAYLDSWLAYRVAHSEIPGVAVAVSHAGELVLERAYGAADLERAIPLTPRHVFRIASHSKSFTAVAVLQLAEQGRLRLDDPAARHLAWLGEHPDRRWRRVTLAQLLSHGAGVVRDGLDSDYWQLSRSFPDGAELRRLALETRLVTDTNVAHKYSNIGFSVLGEVIDAVTGSYHDYVLEHVVGTLGLSGTGPEWRDDLGLEAVTGYTRREPGTGRRPLPALDTRAMAPATGFYGTAGDLCRFFAAQRIGSGKLLSDDSKREMQRVHWRVERPGGDGTEDYGLGLQLQRLGERRTFGHSGGFPGQITRTMADPADRLVVAALTNCIDGPATDIVRAAYGVIDFFQQRPPPRAAAVALEGRYVCLWQAIDVVGSGARLAVGDPDTWQPLKDPDELERVSDDQWRVATTSSYGSPGESVRFELRGGRVEQVRYAGSTMWTEGGWPAARRKLLGEQ